MNCYNKIFQRRITIKSINKNNGDQIRFNRYLKFSRLLNDIRYYRSWKKKKKKKYEEMRFAQRWLADELHSSGKFRYGGRQGTGKGDICTTNRSSLLLSIYLIHDNWAYPLPVSRLNAFHSGRFWSSIVHRAKIFEKTIECLRIMRKARSIVLKFTSHGMWSNLIVQRSENI